jgi:hypothetical protein
MLAPWLTFAAFGTVAGLIVGVILLDFGEQGALVSNQQVIYALRPEARNRLNTIFGVRLGPPERFSSGIWLVGTQSALSAPLWPPSP